jgi:tetratricopeptide (TPR) repeat protein
LQEGVARALVNKGVALSQLNRHEEALSVYDEVIHLFGNSSEVSLQEKVAIALVNKGFALEQLDRSEETISLYDEVSRLFGDSSEVSLQEQVARALVNKGVVLEKLGRPEDAISLYHEVSRRFGDSSEISLQEKVARALNGIAWNIYEKSEFSKLDQGIAHMEKALAISPQNMAFHHTLSCLLGLAARWEEALEHAKKFADDEDLIRRCQQDILSFFVDAAAAGQSESALQVIQRTKSESAMEPLVVALKIYAGKPYRAPREVEEMAKDICKMIEKRAQILCDLKEK